VPAVVTGDGGRTTRPDRHENRKESKVKGNRERNWVAVYSIEGVKNK